MKKLSIFLLISISSLFIASQTLAYTLNVSFNNGTIQETTALTGFATNGAMMDGMNVTATFSAGGFQTEAWAATGVASGGVSGTGWSLSESGDTYGGIWSLNADSAIDRLFLDAGAGDSVFDTTFGGDFGTDGSARGWTFQVDNLTGDWDGNIDVTYIDAVALTGDSPVGDLFRYLDIQFSSGFTGTLGFKQDTDNLEFAGDIQPVPEPATMLLLCSGLAGLAGIRRKFKKT